MINEKITDEDKIKLNINDDMKIKIDEDAKKYLAYHREIFMKKWYDIPSESLII